MNAHEQAVIGGLLLDQAKQHMINHIPAEYFVSQDAHDIFTVMKRLHCAMKPVDCLTVSQSEGMVGSVVMGLADDCFTSSPIEKHVAELRKGNTRKQIQANILRASKLLLKGAEIQDILNALKVESADTMEMGARIYNSYEQAEAYVEYVQEIQHNVLHTGWDKIDEIIPGIPPGHVLTFMGRAGCFKTSALQHILDNYSKVSGQAAALFSLEMPVATLAERYMQSMKGWSCTQVENHFTFNDRTAPDTIAQYGEEYKNLIVVDGCVNMDEIPDYVRLINKKLPDNDLGCIGIDYMGLIDSGSEEEEYKKMSRLARGLKLVAKEIKMPVVVLAQTNRGAGDGTEEVFLHQGRGSGAIEEAGDFIIGAYKSSEDKTAALLFKVLKNKRGESGAIFSVDINKKTFKYTGKCYPWERKEKQKDTFGG